MLFILFLALIVVLILWLIGKKKLQKIISDLTSSLENLEKNYTNLQNEHISLSAKYSKLTKYEGLLDIEEKANEILSNADKIIQEANRKAEEIAGEAMKALNNQKELEKTAKAMQNIIEGYGDQYLVPTFSILDDLADEFGHTEAGVKLKNSREYTRKLIEENKAAKCDYVEAYRKSTAINFVLDAFNGKVDSILSKVKKDNYGTLEQKIRDAYQIVNNNGKAFRDAVITQDYLNARIAELKWAVIAQELKWQEQEEQRMIREQIREEEKARREFERAIKEAQKEEETLKRLIEKAQKEVSRATDEQKVKFEEQLKELEGKLKEAEEKNQRALSMAQQTKSGNVYVISNIGSFGEDVYKIGMTRRLEPLDRIRELGDASVPFEFDVHSLIYSENAPGLESELHKKFLRLQMNKVNPRKEFFRITLADIKNEIDKMNINVKWTMTAEARQYRESLAIEQAISNDKQKQEEWEKYQLELDPVSIEFDEDADA
jgi:Sec-independent protein translocase protein TatA